MQKIKYANKLLKKSMFKSLVNVINVSRNEGFVNIHEKTNDNNGDVILGSYEKYSYKLSDSEVEFVLKSKKQPSIVDLDMCVHIIDNTIYTNLSISLGEMVGVSDTNMKWYLSDNKYVNFFQKILFKIGLKHENGLKDIENSIDSFYEKKTISKNRVILMSIGFYKILENSENFNSDGIEISKKGFFNGGKYNGIDLWINCFSTDQSLIMFNDFNMSMVLSDVIEYDICKSEETKTPHSYIILFKYMYEFINKDKNISSLILTDY